VASWLQSTGFGSIVAHCFNTNGWNRRNRGVRGGRGEPAGSGGERGILPPRFHRDDWLTETADYCAAARIGMYAFKKRRTRSIVRFLSSSGSFHG
jgi:hypothetical protein